jgi:general stress protein 26
VGSELDRWFEDGPESDDFILIKVTPGTVAYWSEDGEGEISLM